jgi:hypothetical protein
MAHKDDYIPSKDAEFNEFFKFIGIYVDGKTTGENPQWVFPADALAAFHAAWLAWDEAYQKTLVPHIPAFTAEKNRVRKMAEKALRAFVNRCLRYPPVTPEDRAIMKIPEHDDTRTSISTPVSRPEFSIELKDICQLKIPFHDQGSTRKARPYGMNGAVISWDVLDSPPAKAQALRNTVLATRTPHTLTFDEADRGKTVYIALQWQNEKGKRGKHSEIQSAIIP